MTMQVADLVGSATEVAVIVALPAATAVTLPVESTVATLVLLLLQVTRLLALLGDTVAVTVPVRPLLNESVVGSTVTLVTAAVETRS